MTNYTSGESMQYDQSPLRYDIARPVMELQGTEFTDLLAKQWKQSDLKWICKPWNENPCNIRTDPKILKRKVLEDENFVAFLRKLSEENNESEEDLRNRARSVLDEMGHTFNLRSVRCLGYGMVKLLKKFFRHLYINEQGIEKLRSVLAQKAVLLLPTHRSYADFVLISYLCFFYDLPLPIIAAGMDFKDMALIGQIMRGCGAFFIRRSFTGDILYWHIVKQYVQLHLKLSEAPFEFFLEGTRSRHGKILPSKLGMLSMALETVLNDDIDGLALVPISISYERTLEDLMYAYELLGIPKPKESTSGLLKASTVDENFGSVYVHVGSPQSVRALIKEFGRVEKDSVTSLIATRIASAQIKQFVVPLSSCLAGVLSIVGSFAHSCDVVQYTNEIRDLLVALGAFVPTVNVESAIREFLEVHKHIVCLDRNRICWRNKAPVSRAGQLDHTAWSLVLAQYSNQLLSRLALPALMLTILRLRGLSISELVVEAKLVSAFLQYEFVQLDLFGNEALVCVEILRRFGLVTTENGGNLANLVEIAHHHTQIVCILGKLLEPYLESWYLSYQYLLKVSRISSNKFVSELRRIAELSLKTDTSVRWSMLFTSDFLTRNIFVMTKNGILKKEPKLNSKETVYSVDHKELRKIEQLIKYRRLFSRISIAAQL